MLLAVLAACGASRTRPHDIADELPTWMTHGEEVRLAVANDLLETGNTVGALDIVRHMRADGYDGPELDLVQGKALRIDGVTSEAERMLRIAQKRLPQDGRASAELCVLYADLQQVVEAIGACDRAVQADKDDARSWNNLGYLRLASGDAHGSLEACEHAVQLDGVEPKYRNNLGMAQAALGRDDLAFRTLKSTMPISDAAYMVGLALERFHGPEQARPWYERALEFEPAHQAARERLEEEM